MPLPLLVEELLHKARARGIEIDPDKARFATDFTCLMLDIALADRSIQAAERGAMMDALDHRTGLGTDVLELVISHCLTQRSSTTTVEGVLDARSFTRRYGLGAALLALDCQFAVASAEGEVSQRELRRLEAVARELQVDRALFHRFLQRWTPSLDRGDLVIPLAGDRMRIGRGAECEIRLDDPEIAAHHASLVRRGDGWWIEAASAEAPTWLEARPVTREELGPGERVRIGSKWLRLVPDLGEVHVFSTTAASALTVRGLRVTVPTGEGPKTILEGIDFTTFAGELVALIGPSGCGKTTLLSAISGVRPPEEGEVLLDGEPFHPLLATNRNLIGEVPQEDIVHPSLTVDESLWYSARLRLAPDLRDDEVRQQVDRVLRELDIRSIRDHRIGDALRRGISGGQRKRVNLGQELLSRSTHVLFLDEPTSGLDPRGSKEIVRQVRELADGGRIVFLVTHDLSSQVVEMVDQVLILTQGGRLGFYGSPEEACEHFGVRRVDEIFEAFQGREPAEIAAAYRKSDYYRAYVGTREKVLGIDAEASAPRQAKRSESRNRRRQLGFLLRRYGRVKLRDRGGLAILLLQAPVLAVLMALVFPQVDPSVLFVISLATLWFGCSSAVREVIAELPIVRRERRAGLRLLPYLCSKAAVLLAICSLQCALLVGVLYPAMGMGAHGFDPLQLYLVALLTGAVGIGLGLAISCSFSSSEAAVGTLPLILIPQIVFGGLIVYVKDMSLLAKGLSYLTAIRWSFNALIHTGDELVKLGGASYERVEVPSSAILYLLGFKTTTDPADLGLPLWALCSALAGMALLFFLLSLAALVIRERRGTL